MELTRYINIDSVASALTVSVGNLDAARHSGSLVRMFRERFGVSQRALSEKSGCPCAALSRWERYGLLPYPKALEGVGRALASLAFKDFDHARAKRIGVDIQKEFRRAFWILVVADQMLDHEDGSGALVATLRELQGVTQKELAVRAGVPSPQVEAWERRGLVPDSGVVRAVAEALDYDPVQLWGRVREERFVDPEWFTATA